MLRTGLFCSATKLKYCATIWAQFVDPDFIMSTKYQVTGEEKKNEHFFYLEKQRNDIRNKSVFTDRENTYCLLDSETGNIKYEEKLQFYNT